VLVTQRNALCPLRRGPDEVLVMSRSGARRDENQSHSLRPMQQINLGRAGEAHDCRLTISRKAHKAFDGLAKVDPSDVGELLPIAPGNAHAVNAVAGLPEEHSHV
jgi:hypothetical protein